MPSGSGNCETRNKTSYLGAGEEAASKLTNQELGVELLRRRPAQADERVISGTPSTRTPYSGFRARRQGSHHFGSLTVVAGRQQ
jgi:hypothetical protein